MNHLLRGFAIATFAVGSTVALAQSAGQRDPNMPDQNNVPAEKIKPQEPSSSSSSTTGSNLSDKLERSEGVIKPSTNIDPGMAAKPPVANPGTMPVIPPPGSPGGDQSVQPK